MDANNKQEHPPADTLAVRDLFWENVTQQLLTSFAAAAAKHPHLADGRVAALTHGGERIAIKAVRPLFACSVPHEGKDRGLSLAVQCTVFQILTPSGEQFTVPLREIRAVHSISDELMKQLESAASEGVTDKEAAAEPFGFGAYAELVKQRNESGSQASE